MSLGCIGQANEADQRKEEALKIFHRIGFNEFSGFVEALARESCWFARLGTKGGGGDAGIRKAGWKVALAPQGWLFLCNFSAETLPTEEAKSTLMVTPNHGVFERSTWAVP